MHPRYLRRLLRRAVFVWLFGRLAIGGVGVLAEVGFAAALPPLSLLLFLVTLAVLAQVDARVMRESVFHANLGTHTLAPATVTVALAVALETPILLLARILS